MNMVEKEIVQLVCNEVCGSQLPVGFEVTNPAKLYELAKAHDIAHLVAHSIETNQIQIDSETASKFKLQYYRAIRRVSVLEENIRRIRMLFEENSVEFILLKGAVLRNYYPERWMRVSGDIDILVKKEDIEKAEKLMVDKLKYAVEGNGPHHDHISIPGGFKIDLHFTLSEREGLAKPLLDSVWDNSVRAFQKQYEFEMSDEMFYLFHVFHMALHFKNGGCGIRPVLDTWILNRHVHSKDKRDDMLERAGLMKFFSTIETISENWFSESKCEIDPEVEEYILTGGLYGGGGRRVAAMQAQKGSRKKYIIGRLFPPYKSIVIRYPILKYVPLLLPFCWIHRLIKSALSGKYKKGKYEIKMSREGQSQSKELDTLFSRMELECIK